MSINYMKLLDDKHEELKSITETYDRVCEEIAFIESVIPEFFSNSGEGEGIRSMYKTIKVKMESPLYDIKVSCPDINRGSHIYNEYVEGMIQFIDDIGTINESVELNAFEEKFTVARDKDNVFVNSLYGGNLNKSVDTLVSEATSNIEFLIDFIPQLKDLKSKCDLVHESVMDDDSAKSKLFKESSDMLFESVSNYCYNTVKNIFECYTQIQDKIGNTKHEKVIPEFVLF